jgi:Flp pilus assembly protein TadD
LDSSNYQPFFNRATLQAEQGKWENAIEDISKAAQIRPDTVEIFVKMGMIHAATGQFEAANLDFGQALKLDPKDKNALYNRGNVKFQQNDFLGAIVDFQNAVNTDSKFAKAFYALGLAQQKIKQSDAACLSLKQANRLGYPDAKDALIAYCE